MTSYVSAHSGFQDQYVPTFSVPEIGNGVGFLDQQREKAIGGQVFRQVQQKMPVLQNPWIEDQLFSVFSQILTQTQLGQPIGLIVIDDPQINAFAVPGGLFALNTGLITHARNMDEVVGVMGHEIAHVTQRHYSRSQEAFKGQGLLALAGIVVGALVASQGGGDAGTAVILGSQAALLDKQLSYSRNQEREADRIGMQYMYALGYNPQSMADFFEVMHRESSNVGFLPDFWLTHPLTSERMSEARLRANQLPKIHQSSNQPEFEILKLYTAVISKQISEQQLLQLTKQNNFAAQLALSAFYLNLGDYQKAQQLLADAKQHGQAHNLIPLIETDIYLGKNQLQSALNTIQSPAKVMPENRALNYKLAEVYIRMHRAADAQQVVQSFIQRNPKDIQGWDLMQQAANIDKDNPMYTVNVLRYRAEKQFWSGQEQEAIKSLLHAQRLNQKNSQAMSITLKKRLEEMQKEFTTKI
ncbi:M48 family metalloprotease [Acinetobacter sp. SAAs470]|nr:MULTISPECIES: M48 family metalloprotease [unclassified Acinetobacter]WOE33043.1 M48 family metalloprotease [Acinetobacter sp. SAAs470]WOE39876.1 M48 family metalloprotease [Acinetobacter sp. SAAs474]